MHIFLTNDDGFSSKGIRYLALSLSEIAKITVIAPETEMSSCSGSLSLRKPLYLKRQKSYGKKYRGIFFIGDYRRLLQVGTGILAAK